MNTSHINTLKSKTFMANEELIRILQYAVSHEDVFDRIISKITDSETTQNKGKLWEEFCKLFLLKTDHDNVWLLSELPNDIRLNLKLPVRDYGIDLIGSKKGKMIAYQAKFRKKYSRKQKTIQISRKCETNNNMGSFGKQKSVKLNLNKICFREISTFISLTTTTGPWDKAIVMTNCDGVLWKGKRTTQYATYAYQKFKNLDKEIYLKMVGFVGHKLSDEIRISDETKSDQPEILSILDQQQIFVREQRMKYFGAK